LKSKDIILANIRHENPPRPGLDFDRGRQCDMIFAFLQPFEYTQKRWVEGEVEYYDDEWGNLWHRFLSGSVKGEIFQPVLRDWSDLDNLQVPDYSHPDCAADMRRQFTQFPDLFKIAGLGGWIFDNARYLRNMDVYFMDMALHPDQLNRLHEKIAIVYEQKIHLAAQAGADAIFIAEDLGTQTGLLFSPKMFRTYFLEMYERLFSMAHQYEMQVILHSCGMNRAILPDLLDAGVNVFQFDQPLLYDMKELANLLKERKAALYCPIDIQQVLPTGDRAIIELSAIDLIDCFQGGLICKNYLDLDGIGVKEAWDDWGYQAICKKIGFQLG